MKTNLNPFPARLPLGAHVPVLIGILGLGLLQPSAWATAYKSSASGTWETTTTWTPNGTPTTSDTVEIQSGHNVTVTSTTATAGGVTIDSGGILSIGNSVNSGYTLTIAGSLANNGSITLGSGGSSSPTHKFIFSGTTGISTWTGSGDISGPKSALTINAGVTLDITALSPGLKFKNTGGSVNFTINGTLIAGSQVVNQNGSTGTLNIGAGATVQCGNANGLVNGAIGTFNWPGGTRTLNPGSSYVFNGSAAQVTPGLPAAINNLTVNNNAGVTLGAALTVTNVVTLTSGKLTTTAANLLTIGATTGGGSVSGGSATAYVSGPLAQIYSAAASKNFPVGVNGNARVVGVNLTTLTGTPTITVTPKEPASFGGTAPAGYTIWATRSWTVASSVASGNVCALTLDGTDFSPDGAATLLGYDGATVTTLGTSYASPNYSASLINLTAASDFALGCPAPVTPSITGVSAPECSPVEVDWGAVSGASTYSVYRKLSGGSYGAALATGLTGTSYFDTAAASGNTYVYAVSATAACGAESSASADSSPVTPTGAPAAPAISSVTPGCATVTVNWGTVSGDTGGYNIYRKLSGGSYGAAIGNAPSGASTYADSTATDATKSYVYAVTAVGACESVKSGDSAGATPTNAGIVNSPANAATVLGYSAAFNVTAVHATAYQWQVNKGSGFVNVVEGVDGTGSATASFTTAAATSAMSGYQYQCVVTGCAGTVTSAAASLGIATHYRSVASGNWGASGTWQVSVDGSTGWATPPSGAFPGASDTVQIRANHSVTNVDNSTNYAAAVTVDTSGTLYMNSQGSTTSSAGTWLFIGGNLANNGTVTGSNPGSGNQNYMVFAGNATWSGSGDISGSKISVSINAGVTLTLGCDVTLRGSTGKAYFQVNGTLYAGAHRIVQGGTSGSSFTLGPGATLETANTGGIGGTGSGTGTWQSLVGGMSLSPLANYIFDGAAAQAAGSGFPATLNNLTVNNSGGTVTLPATFITGTLYVQSGLLSFGATTTSTAGALTFDGATTQATGTWGSTGSGAANIDPAHFADTGYVTVVGPFTVGATTQFRSRTTGNWNVASTWEASPDNGATWGAIFTGFTPGSMPGNTHTASVRSGNTVTLTEAESCGTLNVNSGGTLDLTNQPLTLTGAPTLAGALRMTVAKTGPDAFTGASLAQSAGTLAYGGTLTVTSTGLALANGDTLPLFSAPAYGGGFTTVTGPTAPAGLAANASQLTGGTGGNLTIGCNGSLAVTLAAQVNVTCNGGNNGSITANAATGGSGAGYTYSIDGVNYQAGLAFSGLAAGAYTLTAQDGNGCVSTGVPVTLTQPTVLVASAGASHAICTGGSIQIGGSPTASGGTAAYGYSWSPVTGLDNATIANPTASPASTTLYTVTVTDANGCTANSQMTVTVHPLPTTSAITGPATVNASEANVHYSVTLTSGSSYAWTVPAGASITSGATGPDNNEIVVTFGTTSGNIEVIETSAAGCAGSPATLAVTVQNQQPVTITGLEGTTLSYSGGAGSKFVLLSSPTAYAPLSGWSRVATNTASPGTFTIPLVGSAELLFYSVKSE
jgi:hypothetical protein